jgi:putative two-component system response regulator
MFDALGTARFYRPAFTYERAVAVMRAERGSHFDPEVLDAFLAAEREIKAIMPHTAPLPAASR